VKQAIADGAGMLSGSNKAITNVERKRTGTRYSSTRKQATTRVLNRPIPQASAVDKAILQETSRILESVRRVHWCSLAGIFLAEPSMAQKDQNGLQYARQEHNCQGAANHHDREWSLGLSADAR